MRVAGAVGYPVPEVHDVTPTEMVTERIHGPTMMEVLTTKPDMTESCADALADLHRRLGAVTAPDYLSTPVGDGSSLLHLDLHPGNVILGETGAVVIDWTNAARGPAPADPATFWLLGSIVDVPILQPGVLDRFVARFLGHFEQSELVACLPAIGRVRLVDPNMSHKERRAITRFVEKQVSSTG